MKEVRVPKEARRIFLIGVVVKFMRLPVSDYLAVLEIPNSVGDL